MLSGVEKLPASTLCDRLGLFSANSYSTVVQGQDGGGGWRDGPLDAGLGRKGVGFEDSGLKRALAALRLRIADKERQCMKKKVFK